MGALYNVTCGAFDARVRLAEHNHLVKLESYNDTSQQSSPLHVNTQVSLLILSLNIIVPNPDWVQYKSLLWPLGFTVM